MKPFDANNDCRKFNIQGINQRESLRCSLKSGRNRFHLQDYLKSSISQMWCKTEDNYGTEADIRAMKHRKRYSELEHWNGFQLRVLSVHADGISLLFEENQRILFDVICVQGLKSPQEIDSVRRSAVLAGILFSRTFQSNTNKILLLTRHPITESLFQRFNNEELDKVQPHNMDGVGLTRLHTPAGSADIYTTLVQTYMSKVSSMNHICQLAQAFQLSHFIMLTRRSPLVILAGDLPAQFDPMSYNLQTTFAGLQDSRDIICQQLFSESSSSSISTDATVLDYGDARESFYSKNQNEVSNKNFILFSTAQPVFAQCGTEPLWQMNSYDSFPNQPRNESLNNHSKCQGTAWNKYKRSTGQDCSKGASASFIAMDPNGQRVTVDFSEHVRENEKGPLLYSLRRIIEDFLANPRNQPGTINIKDMFVMFIFMYTIRLGNLGLHTFSISEAVSLLLFSVLYINAKKQSQNRMQIQLQGLKETALELKNMESHIPIDLSYTYSAKTF